MYDIPAILESPQLREALARSVEGHAPPKFLRSVKLKITARCNLRCVMCRYGKGWAPPELELARWCSALTEMRQLGCRKVHFSGGEVLVRRDFENMVAHAAAEGLKVTFTSNLTLLTKDRAKALMRHKISSISTSLDGATAKIHESVRGIEGSYKRTIRAIDRLAQERERRGRRTRLRINFVMMRRNYHEYPQLVRLAHQMGATELVAMPVDTRDTKLRLSKRMIQDYNRHIAPEVHAQRLAAGFSVDDALVYPFGRGHAHVNAAADGQYAGHYYRDHACYAPFMHMFVAWDGKVYLCCMTNGRIDALGDLSQHSVAEVFHGPAFTAIRKSMMRERLPACHQCDMYTEDNRRLAAALPGPSTGTATGPQARRSRRHLPLVHS